MTFPSNPPKDPLKALNAFEFSDQMKRLHEVMKPLEALKAFDIPDYVKDAEKALGAFRFPDQMKGLQDAMKALQVRDYMKDAGKALDAFHGLDAMEGLRGAATALQFRDSTAEALGAIKVLQFPDSMKEACEAIRAFQFHGPKVMRESKGALQFESLLDAMSAQVWPLAYENVDSDIIIYDDKTIAVGSTTLTHSEVQNLVDQIATKAFSPSVERLEQALHSIASEISSLRDSQLQKLLTYLIYPLIVGFILLIIPPIADYYVKPRLSGNDREIKKSIGKHALDSASDPVGLDSYRFVSTKILNVHFNPSSKSPVIGRLHLAQVVFIVKKDRAWSLVTWQGEHGEAGLQGWVFSRYLGKFQGTKGRPQEQRPTTP